MRVAGLVIGGVALASLFETGMAAFDHIEEAKRYGGEYQKLVLKTSLLRLRLRRWADGVEFARTIQAFGSDFDGDDAKALLGHIARDIQDTERVARRYNFDEKALPASASDKKVDTLDYLATKVRAMAIRQQEHTSLAKKTRWALHDHGKFKELIESLDKHLTNLETLFTPEAKSKVLQVAKSQGEELIQASSVEEPSGNDATPIALLAEATEGIDDILKKALEKAAPADKQHIFSGEFLQSEEARVQIGDYVAAGHTATRNDKYSGRFDAKGKARALYGSNYGGKSVYDD